ncbi:hypothetical protein DIPPA_34193 [Diplonema papillatum]|nr:hypothetical protein DIPPA_34193 [Diplonema papillatum]
MASLTPRRMGGSTAGSEGGPLVNGADDGGDERGSPFLAAPNNPLKRGSSSHTPRASFEKWRRSSGRRSTAHVSPSASGTLAAQQTACSTPGAVSTEAHCHNPEAPDPSSPVPALSLPFVPPPPDAPHQACSATPTLPSIDQPCTPAAPPHIGASEPRPARTPPPNPAPEASPNAPAAEAEPAAAAPGGKAGKLLPGLLTRLKKAPRFRQPPPPPRPPPVRLAEAGEAAGPARGGALGNLLGLGNPTAATRRANLLHNLLRGPSPAAGLQRVVDAASHLRNAPRFAPRAGNQDLSNFALPVLGITTSAVRNKV